MKHLTIISGETEPHLIKEFINYLKREPHRFQINEVTYKTKPQFNLGDVVVAERVLPSQTNSDEKRFDSEKITPLAKNGVYVFLLSEFMDKLGEYEFGMADFGRGGRTGLTGIIFKNHAGRLDPLQFRGYNGNFTMPADVMLGSYLGRGSLPQ